MQPCKLLNDNLKQVTGNSVLLGCSKKRLGNQTDAILLVTFPYDDLGKQEHGCKHDGIFQPEIQHCLDNMKWTCADWTERGRKF
jgi:hypothetical protein